MDFFLSPYNVFSVWNNDCREKMLKCCQCFVLLQFLFKSKVCIFKLIIKKKRNFTLDGWFSFFLRVAVLLEKDLFYERLKFTWMVLRRGIVSCKSKLLHSSLRIEMGLCGLSGGRKSQTTPQTGILIVCCTVMFFCSCCLVFSRSAERGEVLLLFQYHQLLKHWS